MLLERISEGEPSETESGFGAVSTQWGNLPLGQLSYHASILALSVRTTILQTYYNPFDEAIEAEYIFPLEYGHAVIACEMRVGNRVVRAELKERQVAREEYAEAISHGYRAALLEENRPETFSMHVGNIPPGETIQIAIQTVSELPLVRGEWTLRLPLVVAPRYTSGLALPRPACASGTSRDTDQVPDASSVTPPTWLPGFPNPIDLRLIVDIDMGQLPRDEYWAEQLQCSLHAAIIGKLDNNNNNNNNNNNATATDGSKHVYRIQLMPGERVNRDFILRGRVADAQASCALASEMDTPIQDAPSARIDNGQLTFAVTIVAPQQTIQRPRRVFFLLDSSGSMSGWKLLAARRGLCRLIDRLGEQDEFAIAVFDDKLTVYTPAANTARWTQATDVNRFAAINWLGRVTADGGTEMGLAIKHALETCCRAPVRDTQSAPAIVLVTDGQVTGEDAVLRLIDSYPPERTPRLFCLGVDRAVNASVLRRIAHRTGGTFELAESEHRLDSVLDGFASEIANPSITELSISGQVNGKPMVDLHIAPAGVDTLYPGRSQTLYGRCDTGAEAKLIVRGRLANSEAYEHILTLSPPSRISSGTLLRALWGRHQLRSLEDRMFASGMTDPQLQQQVVECSLSCGVLSRLTAFVAVDRTEKVTDGTRPHSIIIPVELPEGWSPYIQQLDPSSLIRIPRRRGMSEVARLYPSLGPVDEAAWKKLLEQGSVSQEQLDEAREFASNRGGDVCEALVVLHYLTETDLARAIASVTRTNFIEVSRLSIDEKIVMQMPESVARENQVLPVEESNNALVVAMANPHDLDTLDKLRFIMDRKIVACCGTRTEIADAINAHYGSVPGQSVDSILHEFTDTQIDFTETVYQSDEPIFVPPHYCRDSSPIQPNLHKRSLSVSSPRSAAPAPASLDEAAKAEALLPDDRILWIVELMINRAIDMQASGVNAWLEGSRIILQYTVDGQANLIEQLPVRLWHPIVAHLLRLAGLDPASLGTKQSGMIDWQSSGRVRMLTLDITRDAFWIGVEGGEE